MTTRERWIVYPLLFLTLGIALRDKIVPPTHLRCSELVCDRVVSQQSECSTLVCDRMESKQTECRTLVVRGPNGRPVVVAGADNKTHAGTLETFTAAGVPQINLFSNGGSGMVSAVSEEGKVVVVGHVGQNMGVFAQIPAIGQMIPLTLPLRLEIKRSASPPPQEQSPDAKDIPPDSGEK